MSSGEQTEPTACSFCSKPKSERVRLLTANGLSICNYCVAFAHQVFDAEGQLPYEREDPGFMDFLEDTLTREKPG